MSSLSLLLVLSASATQLNTLAESREIQDSPASPKSSSGLGSVVESRHILITPDYRPPVGFEGGELRPPQSISTLSLMSAGAALNAQIVPSEDATSEFFAARLTAGNQNREVTTVGYRLVGGAWECDSGMEHRVRVWKETRYGMVPVQSFLVEETKDAISRDVSLTLSRPVQMLAGDVLVVAVELSRVGDVSMCLAASRGGRNAAERQLVSPSLEDAGTSGSVGASAFWSYEWASFGEEGLDATMAIYAGLKMGRTESH